MKQIDDKISPTLLCTLWSASFSFLKKFSYTYIHIQTLGASNSCYYIVYHHPGILIIWKRKASFSRKKILTLVFSIKGTERLLWGRCTVTLNPPVHKSEKILFIIRDIAWECHNKVNHSQIFDVLWQIITHKIPNLLQLCIEPSLIVPQIRKKL